IPAFARKYGLPCSACHTVWPELNAFGQKFRDNGYQLGNDRDSPIWQAPAYWPIAVRTTPQAHLEYTTHQPVDRVPGDPTSGLVEKNITQTGLDLSGVDFLMFGTLYKDISFGFVATMEATGETGVEAAFVRFDNLGRSPWVNFRLGKFELDNLLSEKRITFLSNNAGFYQSYHFVPAGDINDFGLGDNQSGAEQHRRHPGAARRARRGCGGEHHAGVRGGGGATRPAPRERLRVRGAASDRRADDGRRADRGGDDGEQAVLPGRRRGELQLRHRRGAAAVHARPRRRLPGDGDARRSAAPGGRAGAGMERRRAGAALHSAAAAPHRRPGGGPADVAPGRSGDPQEARRHRRCRRRVPRLSVHVQSGGVERARRVRRVEDRGAGGAERRRRGRGPAHPGHGGMEPQRVPGPRLRLLRGGR